MATGSRSSNYRGPTVRSLPSSQAEDEHSSGTTVADELLDVVNGADCPESTPVSSTGNEALLLGEHMRELVTVISKLEGLGLQQLQIPLPKCVVLGEQSTGKSSVIEAISGIRTPRAADTCTRCPMFIKMEPSAPNADWQVHVILRQMYTYDGNKVHRFPGWAPNRTFQDVPFASTKSLGDLEDLIWRAQLAVLCPLNDPKEFLSAGLQFHPDNYSRIEFSPNVLCIHVSKPELPALSFYDLPGIIGQSELTENQFLVKFVEDLVTDYVNDEESLVLVTCSLENDLANSKAGKIAREEGATDRCIGVLTKPDRLPVGSREDKLQAILDGNRFPLGHGYFVVKNPGQDGLDKKLTHHDARKQERKFFERNAPWSTTFREHNRLFGTEKLQNCLSMTLATQMAGKLPTIQVQVQERLTGIEADLQKMPEPPTHNAIRTIADLLHDFSSHVCQEVQAEFPCREWRNTWDSLHKEFHQGLLSMKPTMTTSGKLDKGIFDAATPGQSIDSAFVIDSEDEDGEVAMPETPETPSKKRKVEGTPGLMRPPPSRMQSPSRATPKRPVDSKPNGYANLRQKFNLDEITEYLNKTSKSRLPGQLNPKVVEELIIGTLKHWDLPLKHFFKKFRSCLRLIIEAIFCKHFGPWKESKVYQNAWDVVKQLLDTNFTEQEDFMAVESLTDERKGPYVFNEDIFKRELANTKEQYRRARQNARVKVYGQEMSHKTDKEFNDAEKAKLHKDEKKMAIIHAEPYEREIEVIAWVTSYYMIAVRRFYESVCIRIESKFFKRLCTSLRDDLDTNLGIHDNENGAKNAIDLLAEPPHRFEKRKELNVKKAALTQGLEMLQGLQKKYGDHSDLPASQPSFGPMSTPLTDEMEDISRSGLARR